MKKLFLTTIFSCVLTINILADIDQKDRNVFQTISNNYYYDYNNNPTKTQSIAEYNNEAEKIINTYISNIINAPNKAEHDKLLRDLETLLNTNTSSLSNYQAWLYLQDKGKIYFTEEDVYGIKGAKSTGNLFPYNGLEFKNNGYQLKVIHEYNPKIKNTIASTPSSATTITESASDFNLKTNSSVSGFARAYVKLLKKYHNKILVKNILQDWQKEIGFNQDKLEKAFKIIDKTDI